MMGKAPRTSIRETLIKHRWRDAAAAKNQQDAQKEVDDQAIASWSSDSVRQCRTGKNAS